MCNCKPKNVPLSAVQAAQKEVLHGDDLILDIPDRTQKLMFISADKTRRDIVWQRDGKTLKKQKLHVMSQVTFDHAGIYILLNALNSVISNYTVKVKGK